MIECTFFNYIVTLLINAEYTGVFARNFLYPQIYVCLDKYKSKQTYVVIGFAKLVAKPRSS